MADRPPSCSRYFYLLTRIPRKHRRTSMRVAFFIPTRYCEGAALDPGDCACRRRNDRRCRRARGLAGAYGGVEAFLASSSGVGLSKCLSMARSSTRNLSGSQAHRTVGTHGHSRASSNGDSCGESLGWRAVVPTIGTRPSCLDQAEARRACVLAFESGPRCADLLGWTQPAGLSLALPLPPLPPLSLPPLPPLSCPVPRYFFRFAVSLPRLVVP
eukprot:1673169-Pleurochrysis_carterae.AAC.4